MPVTITINGDDASHTLHELKGLSQGLCRDFTPHGNLDNTAVTGAIIGAALAGADAEKPARKPRKGGAEAPTITAESKPAISTGEERVDTETAAVEPAAKLLTVDDVRKASTSYVNKWTMKCASIDLTPCLFDATGKSKISDLEGADQETLKKAVDAFTAAGEAKDRYVPKAA